ncbi:MAG: hypothetical protein ACXWZY_01780 [Gaiellaceae bacterium]
MNEAIGQKAIELGGLDEYEFLCECSSAACFDRISLTLRDTSGAREFSRGPKFAVLSADIGLMFNKSHRFHQLPSRRARRDRIALAAVAAAAFTISGTVNVHERLHLWADQHGRYDPYQLMPVAAAGAVVTLAYLLVTRRRLRQEVAIRKEREDALSQALHKIEMLSGLLAMCASCKRIRDDNDQWEPVEIYLQRHPEISVSHSICPHCTRDLYPDHAEALTQPV